MVRPVGWFHVIGRLKIAVVVVELEAVGIPLHPLDSTSDFLGRPSFHKRLWTGWTPLHSSASKGDEALVDFLLERGAQ